VAPPAAVRVRPLRFGAACALAASLGACGGDSGTRPRPTPTPLTREQAVRDAVRITAAAQLEVMRSVRPGMREGDVKAIVEHVFQREGADGVAFAQHRGHGGSRRGRPLRRRRGVLAEGDLLVVDIGASREGWASDLTRTAPVSGRFTSRQRELYALALEARSWRCAAPTPASTAFRNMQDWVIELYRASRLRSLAADGSLQTLDRFNLVPPRTLHGPRRPRLRPPAWDWRSPLQPGQALTIEPGCTWPARDRPARRRRLLGRRERSRVPLVRPAPLAGEIEAVMDAGRAGPAAVSVAPPSQTLPVSPWSIGRRHLQPRDQPEK